jgi:hypothetical protein
MHFLNVSILPQHYMEPRPPPVSKETTGACIPTENSGVLLAAVYTSPALACSDADIIELLR